MATQVEHSIDAALKKTKNDQLRASNPQDSAWVSANAGTGKTHVLTQRVLRILLSGAPPERILCVTYTKAAAAEMAKRVFDELAAWVMADEDLLKASLADLTGQPASQNDCDRARTLFTSAIETPGGLKVQTIHAFCERLLQRFPLEANIPPGFHILDDKKQKAMIRDAIDTTLIAATASPDTELGRALSTAIAHAADDHFDEVLEQALFNRQWLIDSQKLQATMNMPARDAVRVLLLSHFALDPGSTFDSITAEIQTVLSDQDLKTVSSAFSEGKKTDCDTADRAARVLQSSGTATRVAALTDLFLTTGNAPRKRLTTNDINAAHPALCEKLENAQQDFFELYEKRMALSLVDATCALHTIATAVLETYTAAKRRQSALDFPDLISSSVTLLTVKEQAEWVLFKLDEGLSHILVDESQDTSPEQWQLISALSTEFFSGHGAVEEPRTVFAVGDEKQSIYSFQGAAPQEFARQGQNFQTLAENANQRFHPVPLTLSFRTTEPILDAVDRVFADASQTPGLSATQSKIEHLAKRIGQAGLVEIWPTIAPAQSSDTSPWDPLAEPAVDDPVKTLAAQIADTISNWIKSGDTLASSGQPIQPGHILILVRKRQPFAPAMVAALKARDIAVAGADRINLLEQIAVQDLLSLADFLTLPEDDLALAEVLKSPIFELDDADLIALAPQRKLKTLWKALLDDASHNPRYREAAETLKRWRKQADFAPPYEFFARIFDRDQVRDKLIGRLGPDAGDALDEFIDLALAFDEQESPSLSGFLHWIRSGSHEVKRDLEMGRNEVRVMTVHGAKGLEAPIVFLPDTCSRPGTGKADPVITAPNIERPMQTAPPLLWTIKGSSDLAEIRQIKQEHNDRDIEENNRLLYVAMTRARDRLYVAGFEGRSGIATGSWYQLIDNALDPHLTAAPGANGQPMRQLTCPQSAGLEQPKHDFAVSDTATQRPEWSTKRAPAEPQVSIPLAPSRLAPYEIDDEGEPLAKQPTSDTPSQPSSDGPTSKQETDKFLRGNLTHALLQYLPTFPQDQRRALARSFIDLRGNQLAPSTRANIVDETMAIIENPKFADLFGPNSRAEVPIVADLLPPSGQGVPLRLNGAIDRLVELQDEIVVVDFKTNRNPPQSPDDVADAYLYQLASYRLALQSIYGQRTIRAALLWTQGPEIIEIPSTKLDSYQDKLWQLQS